MREALALIVGPGEGETARRLIGPVFAAAILELLLEDLLFTIAIEGHLYDDVYAMLHALIETNRGREQLLRLYKKLGYEGFAADAAVAGYRDFSARWAKLAQTRNRYVHGRFAQDDEDELANEFVAALLVDAVDLFAALNNKYGRENVPYKAAVQSWPP